MTALNPYSSSVRVRLVLTKKVMRHSDINQSSLKSMTDRNIEDLTWCIQSPSLISASDDQVWPDDDWFKNWPVPTGDFSIQHHKLGKRFESILGYWVAAESSMELIAANLPVHDGNRTVGEFDLLVMNSGVLEHWEVAIKFYLGIDQTNKMTHWYGPNPTDTLATKINRMRSHQLALSHHPAAVQLLAERELKVARVRSFVKGRLFHPLEAFQQASFTIPPEVNPNHEKGWWLKLADFETETSFEKSRFTILGKENWMAPLTVKQSEHYSIEEMVVRLQAHSHQGTVHLAHFDADGRESSRGFVVNERWLKDCRHGP